MAAVVFPPRRATRRIHIFLAALAVVACGCLGSRSPRAEEAPTSAGSSSPTLEGLHAPPPDMRQPPVRSLDRDGEDREDRPYWRRNLFRRIFSDQKFLVTTWWPAELRRARFTVPLVAATLAAGSGGHGRSGADIDLEGDIDSGISGGGNRIASGVTSMGNGAFAVAALGTSYLVSRWSHHDRFAEASSLSAEALINAGIWSTVLKGATARVRPNQDGQGRFFQYGGRQSNSFPTGHAMGAFAVAAVFAEEYRDRRWVPWVAYGSATLIGASRVALGRHFPSDVWVGGILGTSMGHMAVARQREEGPGRWTDRLAPLIDPSQGYGVMYTYTW